MHMRMDLSKVAPETFATLAAVNGRLEQSGLDPRFIHLIKLRASQINGCAYCVDMHVKQARRHHMPEQWINLVCTWRESPVYDARERAVLGWTEALTNLASIGAPDADYEAIRAEFSEKEVGEITALIGMINVWNRVAVGLRMQHPVDRARHAA